MQWWRRFTSKKSAPANSSYQRFPGHPSDVEVFERGDYRIMRFIDQQKLVQGKQHLRHHLDFGLEYLQQHLVACLIAQRPRRVLILGLGVGALPRLISQVMPDIMITIVEHNSAVFDAARSRFSFVSSNTMEVIIEDAVRWSHRNQDQEFDLIFNDCFDGLKGSLGTRHAAYLDTLSRMLAPDGILVTNTIKPECPAPNETYEHLKARGFTAAWPAQSKSNLSLIFSHHPLRWDDITQRAQHLDQRGLLCFSLEDEVHRLRQAT